MSDIHNASWRDSARSVRFFIFEGPAVVPFVFWLLHMRLWVLECAFASMIFFSILARLGLTVPIFFRILRGFFSGTRKLSRPWWVYDA